MAATGYKHLNTAENCTEQCGSFSFAKMNMFNNVHADLSAVCAFLLALIAIIIIGGAIISVIINIAIISVIIIKSHNRTGAREVLLT